MGSVFCLEGLLSGLGVLLRTAKREGKGGKEKDPV